MYLDLVFCFCALHGCFLMANTSAPSTISAAAAKELSRLQKHAYWEEKDTSPWITVAWNPNTLRIEYGCKICAPRVADKSLKMRHRYRDPVHSSCFAHGNVYRNVDKAIPEHDRCKTHEKAIQMEKCFLLYARPYWGPSSTLPLTI